MVSSTGIQIIIAVVGVIVSVATSVWVSGYKTGLKEGNMNSRFAKVDERMEAMGKDLAEIKGMFVLRLRDDGSSR